MTVQTHPRLRSAKLESIPVLPAENVRGFEVHDLENRPVGQVDDLIVDAVSSRVRFLKIGQGGLFGFGRTHRLIPVDIVRSVAGEYVFLGVGREQVALAPEMRSLDDESYAGEVVQYFGCQPFWANGYRPKDWTSSD